MGMLVHVKKRLLGGHLLVYGCSKCQTRLTSPLDDAGKSDSCPDCGTTFVVPGVAEREQIHAEAAAAQQQKMALKEHARQELKLRQDAQRTSQAKVADCRESAVVTERSCPAPPPTSTRRCPYCAEEILAAASKCKHCGEFLKGHARTQEIQMKKSSWYQPTKAAKYGIALIFLYAFVGALGGGNRESKDSTPGLSTSGKVQMIKAAQRGVRGVLKAPSSAEFPSAGFSTSEYSIEELSTNTYRVRGYVDAQNSFGAKLRNEWEAVCKGSGLDWYAASATLLP